MSSQRRPPPSSAERRLAAGVRDACLHEIERAREEAGIRGLCGEGAIEYALDHLRHLPPDELLGNPDSTDAESPSGREDP